MKVSNPYFKQALRANEQVGALEKSDAATKGGIFGKTIFLILTTIAAGVIVAAILYSALVNKNTSTDQKIEIVSKLAIYLIVALIAMSISGVISAIFPKTSFIAGPIYAVGVGSVLGVLCMIGEVFIKGITVMAGAGTAIVFLVTLGGYAAGLKNHMSKIAAGALIIFLSVLIGEIVTLIFFSINPNADFPVGVLLLIEAIYLIYGCACLLMNFSEADAVVEQGFPKAYEWSVALGLLSSIVLIFIELFRLIILIASLAKKD